MGLNFDTVETSSLLPDGTYDVIADEVKKQRAGTGAQQIAIRWKVSSGKKVGKTFYDNFTLTQNALWKLKTFLEASGLDHLAQGNLDDDRLNQILSESKGISLQVTVVIGESNTGKKRNEVTSYTPIKSAESAGGEEEDETTSDGLY